MTSNTNAIDTEKWGKESEKQMGGEDVELWRKEMYTDTIPWEYGRFRELLEGYSRIHQDDVEAEIFKIASRKPFCVIDPQDNSNRILSQRDKAWEVAKYPCIGSFTFLARTPEFSGDEAEMQKAIERLKAPGSQDTFLEMGGFICQTIRQLAFAGVDTSRLYGTDLHAEFIELGYELFRDRESLQATFVPGDILLPDEEYLVSGMAGTLDGKISIIHASHFFHLFSWQSQLVICQRIIRFFRRHEGAEESPAVVFGSHVGSVKPGEIRDFGIFLHDETTFQSLWDEVGKRTATRWKVSVQIAALTPPKPNAFGKDSRVMNYVVRQLSTQGS